MKHEVIYVIKNCEKCPNVVITHTPNTGFALDYDCGLAKKTIKHYCENVKEFPQDHEIPEWCPLEEKL